MEYYIEVERSRNRFEEKVHWWECYDYMNNYFQWKNMDLELDSIEEEQPRNGYNRWKESGREMSYWQDEVENCNLLESQAERNHNNHPVAAEFYYPRENLPERETCCWQEVVEKYTLFEEA